MPHKASSKELLPLSDIAAHFHLPPELLEEWCAAGECPHYIVGGRYRYFRLREFSEWFHATQVRYVPGTLVVERVDVLNFVDPSEPANENAPRELASVEGLMQASLIQRIPCVYFLCRKRAVVYVGATVCLFSRMLNHIGEGRKRFDSVFFLPAHPRQHEALEENFVRTLRPEYNIDANGRLSW